MSFYRATRLPCLIRNGALLCVVGKRSWETPKIKTGVLLGHDLGKLWWSRIRGTSETMRIDESVLWFLCAILLIAGA